MALTPVNLARHEDGGIGSVYESLLDLTPRIADDGRTFLFAEGAEAQGTRARRPAAITRRTVSFRRCSTPRSIPCSIA